MDDAATLPTPVRMSCAETAAYLNVSRKTLANWRAARRGPPYFHPKPGRPFYLRSDLDEWRAASRVRCFAA